MVREGEKEICKIAGGREGEKESLILLTCIL